MSSVIFEVREAGHGGRVGRLRLGDLAINTPALLIRAPLGTVGGLLPEELAALGVAGIVIDSLALALRPGAHLAATLGGIPALAPGLLVVAEAPSLGQVVRLDASSLNLRAPIDGSLVALSPERWTEWNTKLGVMLVPALALPATVRVGERRVTIAREQRIDWQLRSLVTSDGDPRGLAVFAVDDAPAMAAALSSGPFAGVSFAAAGYSRQVPAVPDSWLRLVTEADDPATANELARVGVDLVVTDSPLRLAKKGQVWTPNGLLDLTDEAWIRDPSPIDPACRCRACQFSRGYLRHLVTSDELLGLTLLVMHNIATMVENVKRET